jgi:hypothetical protein
MPKLARYRRRKAEAAALKASRYHDVPFVNEPLKVDRDVAAEGIEAAQKDARARRAFEAFWCRCGNPSGNVTYHPDRQRGAACSKHHWTCDDCSRVVQVG